MSDHVLIIAEAGVNHNGSVELAKKLVDAALEAGADVIKFQSFKAARLVSTTAEKASYQMLTAPSGESQYEMIRKLELGDSAFRELYRYCSIKKISFLSSPFDLDSIETLKGFGLKTIKIPSGEITNLPYLRKVGGLRGEVILSTGMADLGEIEDALDVLVYAGTRRENITVLHCNTEYPTPYEDVNLNAMLTIAGSLKVRVGYSDHTCGIEIPVAAVALGAWVIEKHFTLDRNMEGPDHKASLEPQEFSEMVRAIRNVESSLGNGIKKPSKSEMKNIPVVRKSIVAVANIGKGEPFTPENIGIKRPGAGISPMRWDEVLGRKARRDFTIDELIEL